MSADENAGAGRSATSAAAGAAPECEPLACVSCRSRKLKCDRIKPICTRCSRVKGECVYPESRRKPVPKRRNVRELEARLAQVENALKDAGAASSASEKRPQAYIPGAPDFGHEDIASAGGGDPDASWAEIPPADPGFPDNRGAGELMGLGMSESLPPLEVIEELHQGFFTKQQSYIPVIHPGRYLKAFYSPPHMRPPMALQYAVWTLAANGHPKYHGLHDAFYRRARQYLQQDELLGEGEHFITVAHAQAWAIIATSEARCLWFTRAAMSCARCVRLVHMMGLHRLDSPGEDSEMPPTILPPRDWTELEERRRVLWGAFCIDSHAAISTGWPTLINFSQVTTHLPSSEEAFEQCREEAAPALADVFTGSLYSTFAGTVVVCHIFNRIMQHVHQPKPEDHPEDVERGRFWDRHRELDNLLSSSFMFLPERYRLPKNVRYPIAVHLNLNLHAAVICLHNAACDKAEEYNLPVHVKMASQVRILTSAQEIVNVMKMTYHAQSGYKSPLVSLALYSAAAAYIAQASDNTLYLANLEFLLEAMASAGKDNLVTRAFLRQAVLDIQRNGLSSKVKLPHLAHLRDTDMPAGCSNNIPLFARCRVSRHTQVQSPLPGRLPLGKPVGQMRPKGDWWSAEGNGCFDHPVGIDLNEGNAGGKRKRKSPDLDPRVTAGPDEGGFGPYLIFATTGDAAKKASSTDQTSFTGSSRPTAAQFLAGYPGVAQANLPHRGGSAASSPSAGPASTQAESSSATPGMTGFETIAQTDGVSRLQGQMPSDLAAQEAAFFFDAMDPWGMGDSGPLYSQIVETFVKDSFDGLQEDNPFTLSGDGGGDNSWETGGGSG